MAGIRSAISLVFLPSLVFAGDLEGGMNAADNFPSKVKPSPIQWRTDYNVARREAANKKMPLLLFATFKTCFWAHKMEAETLSDSKIVDLLNQQFIPVKLYVERNPEAIDAFQVQSFPTTIICSWDGKVRQTIEGYTDVKRLLPDLGELFFPEGQCHDFGAVIRGTQAKYGFPIVNSTNAPITITAVRCSHCISPWVEGVAVTKDVLQPNEKAELQVSMDARRLYSQRTATIYLSVSTANGWKEYRFTIMARPEEYP